MREEYEAWFIGKFGYPPMPIHSRVLDFCWEGYQAGRKNSESEIDRLKGMVDEIHAARKVVNQHDKLLVEIAGLRQQLAARDHFVPDTFDGNDICDAWAGLPVEFFNPGPNFGYLK